MARGGALSQWLVGNLIIRRRIFNSVWLAEIQTCLLQASVDDKITGGRLSEVTCQRFQNLVFHPSILLRVHVKRERITTRTPVDRKSELDIVF